MKKKDFNPRKSEITPVGEAISQMLQAYKINGRFDQAALINAWEEVMGAPIASRTGKIFTKNDVLFVEIKSAPLKHELNMSKQKILDNFRNHLGKSIVNEIVLI